VGGLSPAVSNTGCLDSVLSSTELSGFQALSGAPGLSLLQAIREAPSQLSVWTVVSGARHFGLYSPQWPEVVLFLKFFSEFPNCSPRF
jgi:hypothetical protein